MRAYIFYLFSVIFLAVNVQAQKSVNIPESELQTIVKHVDNLVKRDSINEAIIKVLKDSLVGESKELTKAQKKTVIASTIKQ